MSRAYQLPAPCKKPYRKNRQSAKNRKLACKGTSMLQYFSARIAEIAQLVEQRIENSRVTSSSLVLGKHESHVKVACYTL